MFCCLVMYLGQTEESVLFLNYVRLLREKGGNGTHAASLCAFGCFALASRCLMQAEWIVKKIELDRLIELEKSSIYNLLLVSRLTRPTLASLL
jgi:hypothetical protein